MTGSTAVLPVFLHHRGCKFRCGFCNQASSVGESEDPGQQIRQVLGAYKPKKPAAQVELAFYGGDFLQLDETEQRALLEQVRSHENFGMLTGLRVSVRPDSLDDEKAAQLKAEGFTTVEIGAQCLNDSVLEKVGRGHNAQQVIDAAAAVKTAGMALGLQLMLGLPGQTQKVTDESNHAIAGCSPDFVRIFPAIVLLGTRLASMYEKGGYVPMPLEGAIKAAARSVAFFDSKQIPAIQIGLRATEPILSGRSYVAGPFHPRFGEMVRQHLALLAAMEAITRLEDSGDIEIEVPQRQLSVLIGHKRQGQKNLEAFSKRRIIISPVADLAPGDVRARAGGSEQTARVSSLWEEYFANKNRGNEWTIRG